MRVADAPLRIEARVAIKPQAAANDNHTPGIALFPVVAIRYVQTAGVNPPKMAVARLYASENPDALTSGGISSVRYTTMAPL